MNRFGVLSAGAIAMASVIAAGGVATLAADLASTVDQRRAIMKQQSEDLKAISAYVDDKGGDQATAVAKARDLASLNAKLEGLWPAGTSSKDMPGKTNAKPEIWTDQTNFKAALAALSAGEKKLIPALEQGDKAAAKAAMGELGKNGCGACHGSFREKMS